MTTKHIYLSVPGVCGVHPRFVERADIEVNQLGGTFSASLINNGDLNFTAQTDIEVYPGINGYITYVTKAEGQNGNIVRLDGYIRPMGGNDIKVCRYLDETEYKLDGVTFTGSKNLKSNRELYKDDPQARFISAMTASKLMQRIATDNGLPIDTSGLAIDYKIYEYYVDGSKSVLQELETLALAGGSNCVLRGNQVYIIPWPSSTSMPSVGLSCDHSVIETQFEYSVTKSDYNGVEVRSSHTQTPWNSGYVGYPEKIGTLSFEAGPVSVQDISFGTGAVKAADTWYYPLDSVAESYAIAKSIRDRNSWLELQVLTEGDNEQANPIYNYIKSTADMDSCWDYIETRQGSVDYRSAFRKIMQDITINGVDATNYNFKTAVDQMTYTGFSYLTLVRWSNVFTRVNNSQDIYPFVYVVPGTDAPDFVENKTLFEIPDTQELTLTSATQLFTGQVEFKGELAENINGETITESVFKGVTPDGFGFNPFNSKGDKGFDYDGSFLVKALFTDKRKSKKAIVDQRLSIKVYRDEIYRTEKIGTITLYKDKDYADVENISFDSGDPPADTLARHLDDVWRIRTQTHAIVPGIPEGAVTIPPIGPSVTPTRSGFVIESKDMQAQIDREDLYLSNVLRIKTIVPVKNAEGEDEITKARIWFMQSSRINYTGNYCFVRGQVNHDTASFNKVSSTAIYEPMNDSGLVEENTESIKGSWSLYALKRKTYRGIYILNSRSGQRKMFYSGIATSVDDVMQQEMDQMSASNPKVVESPLVTECIGSNSHCQRLAEKLAAFQNAYFYSYSAPIIAEDMSLPLVGSVAVVGGIPGIITSARISISSGPIRKVITTGVLPTI